MKRRSLILAKILFLQTDRGPIGVREVGIRNQRKIRSRKNLGIFEVHSAPRPALHCIGSWHGCSFNGPATVSFAWIANHRPMRMSRPFGDDCRLSDGVAHGLERRAAGAFPGVDFAGLSHRTVDLDRVDRTIGLSRRSRRPEDAPAARRSRPWATPSDNRQSSPKGRDMRIGR